jgi:diguanylate cyclase (GGDEF)-like protein/PAS domain S-box-containing protein
LSTAPPFALTPAERAWIKAHPRIRLAHPPGWAPIASRPDGGPLQGLAQDYRQRLEALLGRTFDLLPERPWSEVLAQARWGEVDVVLLLGQTPERDYLRFTEVVTELPYVVIARSGHPKIAGLAGLQGERIAVAQGFVAHEWLAREHPELALAPQADTERALMAVAFGEADAYVGDIATASQAIATLHISNLKLAGTLSFVNRLRIGVRRDWPELVALLNRALAQIPPAERQALWEARVRLAPSGVDPRLVAVLGVVAVFAIILILMISHLRLRRAYRGVQVEVQRRTAALAQEQTFVQHLMDSMPGIFYLFDAQGRLKRWNRRFQALSGYPEEDLPGRLVTDFVPPAEATLIRERMERVFAVGADWIEAHFRTRSGDLIPYHFTGVRTEVDGRPHLIGLGIDVNARQAAEAEAREIRELNREIVASVQQGVIVYDPAGRFRVWNAYMEGITGKTAAECLGRSAVEVFPFLVDTGIPAGIQRALAGELIRNPDFPWSVPETGRYGWARSEQMPLYNGQGEIVGVVEVVTDVTAQRQVEEVLRQSAAVFENTADGILVTDPQERILAVNPAFTRITGYTAAEVVGRTPRLFHSGRQDRAFYEAMWREIAAQGRWQGQVWNRRKDGEVFPEWLSISAVQGPAGEVVRYVATFSDITVIKEAHERLDHLAHHDPLTALPNRLLFGARLDQALARARREGAPFAVVLIDLDRFKEVNDTLGHHIGDLLLQQAAGRIAACVREEDVVARLGGDEFAILMESLAVVEQAGYVANRAVESMATRFAVGGHEFFIGASAGIALYPQDGTDAQDLLKSADAAMYLAKGQGRGRICFFTQELTVSAGRRLHLETSLRRALDQGEFSLHYQPQIDLATGALVGVEALLRWHDPERGEMVPPLEFLPLAEESALIDRIGAWVLRTACAQGRAWLDQGCPLRVAVNLSVRQLRPGLFGEVVQALEDAGLPPSLLELEITESMLMQDPVITGLLLNSLTAHGIEISIDDFGTGFSSLAYLKHLPVKRLKIDRAFINGLPTDPSDVAITRAVLALAHSMGLEVIAEGVETEVQARFLRENGCGVAQGFYFGRPVPPEALPPCQGAAQPCPVGWRPDAGAAA